MNDVPADVLDRLREFDQGHLLLGLQRLTPEARKTFFDELRGIDFATVARGQGMKAERVTTAAALDEALRTALIERVSRQYREYTHFRDLFLGGAGARSEKDR